MQKLFAKQLVNNLSCPSQTANKLNAHIYFVILAINVTITLSIFKAKLFPKSIPKFDENYKKAQIRAKKLKKIWKKKRKKEN